VSFGAQIDIHTMAKEADHKRRRNWIKDLREETTVSSDSTTKRKVQELNDTIKQKPKEIDINKLEVHPALRNVKR
jgi:hypothetical protein